MSPSTYQGEHACIKSPMLESVCLITTWSACIVRDDMQGWHDVNCGLRKSLGCGTGDAGTSRSAIAGHEGQI